MADFDERELIERCRTGDDFAFGELVDRYKNLVYAMVYRMVYRPVTSRRSRAGRVPEGASRLPYFRGDARLSTWIYRIVSNVCLQARAAVAAGSDGRAPGARRAARRRIRRPGAARPAGQGDRAAAGRYRLLVAAHYLEGVQYEALAEALDIPVGTVKTHLYRAKRRLRELLT